MNELAQEIYSLKTKVSGQPLDRPEAEVSQPLLNPPNIRAVVAELLGELLLAQTKLLPMGTEVSPERPLQFTFH